MKRVPPFFLCLLLITAVLTQEKSCKIRSTGKDGRLVCVCNEDFCDTFPKPTKLPRGQYVMYTSNKEGLRLNKTTGNFADPGSKINSKKIEINRKKKYQKILGFGGAFTDATGINLKKLKGAKLQNLLMQSYFGENGLGYNLCRVPIGGTDFSTHGYTYDDLEKGDQDPGLEKFELQREDHEYKIPLIKDALELSDADDLKFLASVWSAPKWMKTNGEYTGVGFIKKKFYQTWAEYFLKFLERYDQEGIEFWGVTTQNEPSTAFNPTKSIPSNGWINDKLAQWVGNNLGPTIRNSKYDDTKILVFDDQQIFLPMAIDEILKNKTVREFVEGIAMHWYLGGVTPDSVLVKTHEHFPDKIILSTEACAGFLGSTGPDLGSWERGESYSDDIIHNLRAWVVGWVDWNMVLDTKGGPTYIKNWVDSPIIVGDSGEEFYKQPMYYHVGHFSKFLPRDSVAIGSKSNLDRDVLFVALERPDNATVVIVLNGKKTDLEVVIEDDALGMAEMKITKKSINSILFWG